VAQTEALTMEIDLGAALVERADAAVAEVIAKLQGMRVSARAVVAGLTDWIDGWLAQGVATRAVATAVLQALDRRGLRVGYQAFRNYRYQTSCLLGAGARERLALVQGADHGHLRASPLAVAGEAKEPRSARALERAIELVGVCKTEPGSGVLNALHSRLQPVRAMAAARFSAVVMATQRAIRMGRRKTEMAWAVSAPVQGSGQAASTMGQRMPDRQMAAVEEEVRIPGAEPLQLVLRVPGTEARPAAAPTPASTRGPVLRPAPPLKPVARLEPDEVDLARQRAERESDERLRWERSILLKRDK
jgi:hypothetical protein